MGANDAGEALVVTTYGRRFDVRLAAGDEVTARVKGRRLKPVCGDRVSVRPIANEPDWLIVDVLPRRNELTRPDLRGRREILAANLTLLVVVASDPPKPDWFIVDRYLSAAELMGIEAAVVFNKIDLNPQHDETTAALEDYLRIGYPVVRCSAKTGRGLEEIEALLRDETAILLGQSGVGKSSLINRLTSGTTLKIGPVSDRSGEGRHTTVNSAMLDMPHGGSVIDSPGVRDYAPAIESPDRVVAGFREIEKFGRRCRYANCRHLREPGCAVKAATADGRISPRRYESYKRLVILTGRLLPGRRTDRR